MLQKHFPTFFLESTLALVVFHLLNRPPEIARVWCQAWSYRIFETGFEWKSGWVTIELEWKMIWVKNYENAGLSQRLIEGKCEVGWKLSWSKILYWVEMGLSWNTKKTGVEWMVEKPEGTSGSCKLAGDKGSIAPAMMQSFYWTLRERKSSKPSLVMN